MPVFAIVVLANLGSLVVIPSTSAPNTVTSRIVYLAKDPQSIDGTDRLPLPDLSY